jgi:PPM family protein phosphatase
MISVTLGAATLQGTERGVNQDCVYTQSFPNQETLALIADGLGAYDDSAEASSLACTIAANHLKAAYETGRLNHRSLANAIQAANLALWQRCIDERLTLKTTLSALICDQSQAYIAHVGDCRIYLVRDERATQLTNDHSWANDGTLRRLLRRFTNHTSEPRHVLSRVVGDHPIVRVDTQSVALQGNDRFILCSDGVWSALGDVELQRIVSLFEQDDDYLAQELVRVAQERESIDDVSAIVMSIHGVSSLEHSASTQVVPSPIHTTSTICDPTQSPNAMQALDRAIPAIKPGQGVTLRY